MRWVLAAILLPAVALAQASGTCENLFQVDFPPDCTLRMHVRSGDIEIVGTDSATVKVSCELRENPAKAKGIAIRFKPGGQVSELRVRGGPNNDVRIRIGVPNKTHLWVRSPAGDLTVAGVTGSKDIEIHAGDLTISVGNPSDYRHADASVFAGDLTASAFGVVKSGLFRSFEKDDLPGQYRLHAHVGAGDLVLH